MRYVSLAPLCLAALLSGQSTVLFQSDFEAGVTLSAPRVAGSQWWQDLAGAEVGGHRWPDDLPAAGAEFQFQVGPAAAPTAAELAKYVENRLDPVVGPYGAPSTALYLAVAQDDPGFLGTSRTNYLIYSDSANTLEEAYCRVWLKLQPDLDAVLSPSGWRVVAEWMEQGTAAPPNGIDYRVTLFVLGRSSAAAPFWRLQAEQVLPTRTVVWSIDNRAVPVPAGEWFELELDWKRSTGADGRYWVAVDGVVVFEHLGPNMKDSALKSFQPFKCYTGTNSLARGLAYQWIDGFELRDARPAARRYGCGVNPPGSLTLLSGEPVLGTTFTLGVDDPLGTQSAGAIPLLMLAWLADPALPCGTLLPGFGMGGRGAAGELLLWPQTLLGPPLIGQIAGVGPAAFPVPLALEPALHNLALRAQGGLVDPATGAAVPVGLTDGLVLIMR